MQADRKLIDHCIGCQYCGFTDNCLYKLLAVSATLDEACFNWLRLIEDYGLSSYEVIEISLVIQQRCCTVSTEGQLLLLCLLAHITPLSWLQQISHLTSYCGDFSWGFCFISYKIHHTVFFCHFRAMHK